MMGLDRSVVDRLLDLRREVAQSQKEAHRLLASRLAARGELCGIPDLDDLAAHIVPEGGFRLASRHVDELSGPLRHVVNMLGGVRDGTWSSRGYAYYALDPLLHLPGHVPSPADRLRVLAARLRVLPRLVADAVAGWDRPPVPFADALAMLAAAEWLLNDLWTLHWAWISFTDDLRASVPDSLDAVSEIVMRLANASGSGSIADLQQRMIEDDVVATRLATLSQAADRGAVVDMRALREGDQLVPMLALLETHARPLLDQHPTRPILLASEAFGAIHVGGLWRHALADRDVEVAVVRGSIHEMEMSRLAPGVEGGEVDAPDRLVLHLDDSVFTGRTHERFLGSVRSAREIRLCAMTVDLGTPFNHPDELSPDPARMHEAIDRLEHFARSVDGRLPSALSYWARRKRPARSGQDPDAIVATVLGGSDRLVAALWARFEREIRHHA